MERLEWIYNGMLSAVVIGTLIFLTRHKELKPKLIIRTGFACSAVAILLALMLSSGSIFGLMRLCCWAIFAHGVVWLGVTALITRRSGRWLTHICLSLAILLAGVGIDAFLIEPSWLQVTTYKLKTPRVSRTIRIALLADLQTDHITAWERSVLERMMARRPDVILVAGDTLQLRPEHWTRERDALRRLWRETHVEAPMGVVVVGGNTDTAAWPTIYEGLGAHTIEQTQIVDLGDVVVTGLSEIESFNTDARVHRPDERYHIVLGHSPDFALGTIDADLSVAGHTHGGQVQIPFVGPILTFAQIPRSWADGLTSVSKDHTLVVSRGIGMERLDAPRLRFWCRPQLVLIELSPT